MATKTKTQGGGSLRERRQAAGLSQQKLAEIAGCSVAAIGLYEGGYSPAHSQVLRRVFAALEDEHPAAGLGAVTTSRGGHARDGKV